MATVEEAVKEMSREQIEPYAVESLNRNLEEVRDYLEKIGSYAVEIKMKKEGANMNGDPEGMLRSYKQSFKRARRELKNKGVWQEDLDMEYLQQIKKQYLLRR